MSRNVLRVAHLLKMTRVFAVATGVVRCGRSISILTIRAQMVAPVVAVAAAEPGRVNCLFCSAMN